MSQAQLRRIAPRTYRYLLRNKNILQKRERGKFKDRQWYRFGRSQNLGAQEQSKICVPRLVSRIQAFFDGSGRYYLDNVDVGGVVLKQPSREHYLAVTALLNSALLTFQLRHISTRFRGGFYSCNRQYLEKLNIALPSRDTLSQLANLSKQMTSLFKALPRSHNKAEQRTLQDQIKATDRAIDQLVYQLYGLTKKEIALVEQSFKDSK